MDSQGVHELDCFPHDAAAAAAIKEQTVDVCTERSCSAKEVVFDGFPQLLLPRKEIRPE